MALNVISADEPISVERTSVLIFGDPDAGKTSLAFTSENPLLLDFKGRGGAHRSVFRKGTTAVINTWAQIDAIDFERDLAPYSTLVLDTVGALQDVAIAEISKDPDNLKSNDVELAWAGWALLKAKFDAIVKHAESLGMDIIFVAHSKEVTNSKGEVTDYRPEVSGGARNQIYQDCDSVCRLYKQGTKRFIDWSGGKDPAGYGCEEIPNFALEPDYLAKKIDGIKGALGRLSDEGKRIAGIIQAWAMELEQAGTADDINALVQRAKDMDDTEGARKQVKAMIAKAANGLGLKWSKEVGGYAG